MVDEFQDTNLAQMRILHNLTNHPSFEGKPNILVVGDDDQAIFSFQGADISNILQFHQQYPKAARITLTDNYRSGAPILTAARGVIVRGSDRLEAHLTDIDKTLTPHAAFDGEIRLQETATTSDEREWIVHAIQAQLQAGVSPKNIAVLARRHHEIISLLPYFADKNIPVAYERRDNVLDLEPIRLVERVMRIVVAIHESRIPEANALLPELLAHPAWGFAPQDIWKLSKNAYESRITWLEQMGIQAPFVALRDWLLALATQVPYDPVEQLLDVIVGRDETETDEFRSPLFSYFFADTTLETQADLYLRYLEGLRTIRTKLREYQSGDTLSALDFLRFIDLHVALERPITSIHAPSVNSDAVQLMTAHKSKGQEFDHVYLMNAVETQWGERARSKPDFISYPDNLPLAPAGSTADERLRLFFVAMTRAKRTLTISYARTADNGATLDRAGFLHDDSWDAVKNADEPGDASRTIRAAEQAWYEPLVTPSAPLKELLAPQLEVYKLSPTHLNAFIDLTHGGPQQFLLDNILHFPHAMSPASAYGTAIHAALQRAHQHLTAHESRRPIEDVVHDFVSSLRDQRLSEDDFTRYQKKVQTH